jgi:pSer/pThr/pTyr-binding forkhead associated (FHA) protein
MQVIVEVQTGPGIGKKLVLQPGKLAQVGRTSWADLAIPQDASLSGMHFSLECSRDLCRLRDQGSGSGTLVNGLRVTETVLRHGDRIQAGQSTFVVFLEGEGSTPLESVVPAGPKPAPANSTPAGSFPDLLQLLRRVDEPLFALLDAARDPKVLQLLRESKEEYQSLYEGVQGEVLADFAPYLVQLPAPSAFLERLVREGWGKSWGVYLMCSKPLAEVRKHFRHFLLVKDPEGKEFYFRFYDPRVLRVFLPTCTPQETSEFFGPIRCFLLEGKEPQTLLRLQAGRQGAQQEALAVAVPQ